MEAIHDGTIEGLIIPVMHWVKRARDGDVIIRIGSVLEMLRRSEVRLLSQADYRRIVQAGDCPYAEWSEKKQADFMRADRSQETTRTKGPLVIDPVKRAEETGIPVTLWESELAIVSEAERLERSGGWTI